MNRGWTVATRALAMGLAALLVLLVAGPVEAYWRGGFWIGLGTGALLTAPFWWPYAYGYPAYPSPYPYYYPYSPYPYYLAYPGYAYPAPPAGSVPPPASPATPTVPTPSPLTPSPPAAPAPSGEASGGAPSKCETVWVEGHYETHVGPGGQAVTVWVPGGSRQVCQ
jgi:hypothetical protein